MSSCGLKASEGQRFKRKQGKERGCRPYYSEEHEDSQWGNRSDTTYGASNRCWWSCFRCLCSSVSLSYGAFVWLLFFFFFLSNKVIFCCVVNWIPGAFPELCCTLISFRTAVEPFLLPIWDRRLEHNEVEPAGQRQKGWAIGWLDTLIECCLK